MQKRTVLFALCSLFLIFVITPTFTMADFYVIPVSNSPLSGAKKSICEFPYWQTGGHIDGGQIEVKYDLRYYDPDYYTPSQDQPNGGIRFDLWLGTFSSAAERDAVADKISKFVLFNNDTGDYYEVTRVSKYDYLGNPSGDFGLWLTHSSKVLGNWDIVIVADGKKYAGSITLTQDMLDRTPPIAVDPVVTTDGSQFTVTAPLTNGEQYRFRIFDEKSDIVYQENMTIDSQAGTATSIVPLLYADDTARIETRIYTDQWIAIMNWGDLQSCNANGGVSGTGTARSLIWFKIQTVP